MHVQGCLILSQVGLLFPVNHGPMKLASLTGFAPVISCMKAGMLAGLHHRDRNGEGRRICASDLMHVTYPLWLAELGPRKWWGRRVLPSLPLACQTSALLMSYIPEKWSGRTESHRRLGLGTAVFWLLNHTREKWCPQPDSHQQPGV